MANAPIVIMDGEEELEMDYDSDGNPIVPDRAKVGDLTSSWSHDWSHDLPLILRSLTHYLLWTTHL